MAGEEAQDAELISRVRSGDRSAFGELFTRHHSAALKAATRFCAGTRTSAEDCVSDAFTQILAALQRGKGPDEFFRAYLYTVMRNAVQAGSKSDSESVTVDDFEVIERNSKKHKVDPAITRFETKVVRAAFASLPERWQSVLWYSDIEAMKPAEVAPILGLTSHGVSMLRTRAREGLKNAYLQAHLSEVTPGSVCATVAPKLGGFARMTLAARDRTKVTTHLADCADCNAMSAEVKNVNRGLLGIIALLFLGNSTDDILGLLGRGAAGSGSGASVAASVASRVGSSGLRAGRLAAVSVAGAAAAAFVILMMVMPGTQASPGVGELTAEDSRDDNTEVMGPDDDTTVASDEFDDVDGTEGREETVSSAEVIAVLAMPPVPVYEPPVQRPDDTPVSPVKPPVEPEESEEPPVVPVNLLTNGGFDGSGIEAVGGMYYPGDIFDGWTVGSSSSANPAGKTMQIWYEAMGEPTITYAAPFPQGAWPRIMGTISQSIPTEVGKTYIIEYETRASGSDANQWAVGWAGGNEGFAAVNGERIDSFVTVATPVYSPRSVNFIATGSQTEISFGNAAGGAIGIDSVSVKIVP